MKPHKFARIQNKIEKELKILEYAEKWHVHLPSRGQEWKFAISYSEDLYPPPADIEGYLFYRNKMPEKFRDRDYHKGGKLNPETDTNYQYDDLYQKFQNMKVVKSYVKLGGKTLYFGPEKDCEVCGEKVERRDEVLDTDVYSEVVHFGKCAEKYKLVKGLKRRK